MPICDTPHRYKIKVAYDGTDFHGWQRQPDNRSVQQELEEVITKLSPNNEPVVIYGSGRTDAGVHADGQIAHFDLKREISGTQLRRAINGWIAQDVRVLDAEEVPLDFHARHSAHSKEYRYRIYNHEIMHPLFRRTHAHVVKPLDIDRMKEAASYLIGEHDFVAFSANPSREIESTVRIIYNIDIVKTGNVIEFRVFGNGFLYKMVRSISGILISIGSGHREPTIIKEIMESKVRTAVVETAPARGLTLWEVFYF